MWTESISKISFLLNFRCVLFFACIHIHIYTVVIAMTRNGLQYYCSCRFRCRHHQKCPYSLLCIVCLLYVNVLFGIVHGTLKQTQLFLPFALAFLSNGLKTSRSHFENTINSHLYACVLASYAISAWLFLLFLLLTTKHQLLEASLFCYLFSGF